MLDLVFFIGFRPFFFKDGVFHLEIEKRTR